MNVMKKSIKPIAKLSLILFLGMNLASCHAGKGGSGCGYWGYDDSQQELLPCENISQNKTYVKYNKTS